MQSIINIERATDDLKRGVPLKIKIDKEVFILLSPENYYNTKLIKDITSENTEFTLSIPEERAQHFFNFKSVASCKIKRETILEGKILDICKNTLLDKKTLLNYNFVPSYKKYLPAINFAKLAEVIPSVITFPLKDMSPNSYDFLELNEEDIENYTVNCSLSIKEAARAKLSLKYAEKAEIIAFKIFGLESYAIIIGTPKNPPLIRIHSSCYTGDLLSSLSCDCRDQLHEAIKYMNSHDGGIIIYMMQEGRNIGLINKIRVYGIKECNIDTADANQILGFSKDERNFIIAAKILTYLNFSKIKILSNNPKKIKELEKHNIEISERIPLIAESNNKNHEYLKTKACKLDHYIPIQQS